MQLWTVVRSFPGCDLRRLHLGHREARPTASSTSNGARVLYWDDTAPQNFEVRLYENDPNGRFDVVYWHAHSTDSSARTRVGARGVQGNGSLKILH